MTPHLAPRGSQGALWALSSSPAWPVLPGQTSQNTLNVPILRLLTVVGHCTSLGNCPMTDPGKNIISSKRIRKDPCTERKKMTTQLRARLARMNSTYLHVLQARPSTANTGELTILDASENETGCGPLLIEIVPSTLDPDPTTRNPKP